MSLRHLIALYLGAVMILAALDAWTLVIPATICFAISAAALTTRGERE